MGKVILVVVFGKQVIVVKFQVGKFIGGIVKQCGGGGGGCFNLVQVGGCDGVVFFVVFEFVCFELVVVLVQF